MIKYLISILVCFQLSGDFYNYSLPSAAGGNIRLSDYRGKKILIVNTASNSPFKWQFERLEQLRQKYSDSLIVIAVPSNDFGNEPLNVSQMNDSLHAHYSFNYPVATPQTVTGAGQINLYKWLTDGHLNENMNSTVRFDFQKYLINGNGQLVGYFAGAMDPLDSSICNTIENKFN